jgi:hypothetical protein
MNDEKLIKIFERLGEICEIAHIASVTPDDDFAKIKELCKEIVDETTEIRFGLIQRGYRG